MNWNECIEEAKLELGIRGWTENWSEVTTLAKEKYWNGKNFKNLKEETIDEAGGVCKLCKSQNKLTAHHIFYGKDEETICLCKECHGMMHKELKRYGFVLQLVLLNISYDKEIPNNLTNMCNKIKDEITFLINQRGSN